MQVAQIRGLFLGLCWAIWRLWWAMLGYVEAMLGGLADGGGDFCRARTISPSSPTICPDRGIVLGPMLGHLEAVLAKNGGPCWTPSSFWQPECKENPLLTQIVSKLPQRDKPWELPRITCWTTYFFEHRLIIDVWAKKSESIPFSPKLIWGWGVLLDHPRKPSNLTLQNSTSPQIGQKYQTIPNWPKFTQTVWRNQAMRT